MRHLYAIVLACMLAMRSYAQVGDPRCEVSLGVTGGMTMNSVSFSPSVPQTLKMSSMFGFVVRYNSEKYFSSLCGLQMEINYLNLGWKQDFSETSTPQYRYSRDIHYISVPIMARMAWGKERKGLMGYILAGPQLGYAFDESETMSDELRNTDTQLSTARRAQYGKAMEQRFDYGITAGGGIELNMSRAGHITLQVRYYLGLADIFNNGKADYFGRSANGTISVSLSYLFDVLR